MLDGLEVAQIGRFTKLGSFTVEVFGLSAKLSYVRIFG